MKTSQLTFLVVGAGAIGGITASLLRKYGYDVEIVCRHDEYARLIAGDGLKMGGICGDFSISMPAYASPEEVSGQKDIILLATKATEMLDAARNLLPLLKPGSYVVSMQNGFCEWAIGSVVGMNRIIGCVTGWGATMYKPGVFEMTSAGDFILGYPERKTDEFLEELAEILSSIVPAKTTDNIAGHLYSKLIINSCITSLGAICGLFLGKMLVSAKIRRIFIGIIKEAMDVADRMNIKVELFGGKLDFNLFREAEKGFPMLKCHIILLVIGFRYRKLKSSSLQSLERGKRTEIDFLNGFIVENAARLGISVPVNSRIVEMIHEIEDKKRTIGIDNFRDPFFNRFS